MCHLKRTFMNPQTSKGQEEPQQILLRAMVLTYGNNMLLLRSLVHMGKYILSRTAENYIDVTGCVSVHNWYVHYFHKA